MLSELERESNRAYTENDALANRSTGSHCLNFFAVCGALRNADEDVACRLFARAWAEDPDLALRALFYARDIRGGLGERNLFREIIAWLATLRPASVRKNLALIPEYGRWDDLLALLDTPCEGDAIARIREQLLLDERAAEDGQGLSLLAKWLPSVNTASAAQRARARRLCNGLGMSEREYRRRLSRLRRKIDVLERRLCGRDYSFDYSRQPSGAMYKYRQAFLRNDHERYTAYIESVLRGDVRLHAGRLYPYEIVRACLPPLVDLRDMGPREYAGLPPEAIRALDASWKSLPAYGDARNALAVIDGSGSMYSGGNPLPAVVAMSLGIYFAERNTGPFKDCFITFSMTPRLVRLEGKNIVDRVLYCMSYNECANTNLRATFELLLHTALRHNLPQSEMPETIYIISDMEFDEGVYADKTLFEEIAELFERNGYRLPKLVYWNVDCRNEQYPVRKDQNGTVLVSGCSPSMFQMVIGQDISPEKFMLSVLNGERYRHICA